MAGCFISAQYEKILWVTIFLTIALGDIARRRLALEAAEVVEPEPSTLVSEPSTS